MILNGIVSSSFKKLCNVSPFIVLLLIRNVQNELFFFGPVVFLDSWVEVVMPSLTALLSNPSWEILSNTCPFLGTFLLNQLHNESIFFLGPWTFYKIWVQNFLPSVQALDISSSWNHLGNLLPVLLIVLFDSDLQLVILLSCPMTFVGTILVLGWTSLVQSGVFSLSLSDNTSIVFETLTLDWSRSNMPLGIRSIVSLSLERSEDLTPT